MPDTSRVQLGPHGELVFPKALRERYNLQPGDTITLLDIGGVFILRPQPSEIDAVADQIKEMLITEGATLDSMLKDLREARDRHTAQS